MQFKPSELFAVRFFYWYSIKDLLFLTDSVVCMILCFILIIILTYSCCFSCRTNVLECIRTHSVSTIHVSPHFTWIVEIEWVLIPGRLKIVWADEIWILFCNSLQIFSGEILFVRIFVRWIVVRMQAAENIFGLFENTEQSSLHVSFPRQSCKYGHEIISWVNSLSSIFRRQSNACINTGHNVLTTLHTCLMLIQMSILYSILTSKMNHILWNIIQQSTCYINCYLSCCADGIFFLHRKNMCQILNTVSIRRSFAFVLNINRPWCLTLNFVAYFKFALEWIFIDEWAQLTLLDMLVKHMLWQLLQNIVQVENCNSRNTEMWCLNANILNLVSIYGIVASE